MHDTRLCRRRLTHTPRLAGVDHRPTHRACPVDGYVDKRVDNRHALYGSQTTARCLPVCHSYRAFFFIWMPLNGALINPHIVVKQVLGQKGNAGLSCGVWMRKRRKKLFKQWKKYMRCVNNGAGNHTQGAGVNWTGIGMRSSSCAMNCMRR